MADDRDELSTALRAVADAMLAREPEHPSAEELVRHSHGELSGADQERVQDHLAICPDCARLRLALPQLATGGKAAANADSNAAEDFERLRSALVANQPSRLRYLALAAALLMAVGLGWVLARVRAPRDLQPAINLPVAVLSLDPSRQTTETLVVPSDAELLMVVVPLPADAAGGVYRVRVSHRASAYSWTSPPVEPRQGEITLTFGTRGMPPGLYAFTVDQLGATGPRRVGERSLRIHRVEGGAGLQR